MTERRKGERRDFHGIPLPPPIDSFEPLDRWSRERPMTEQELFSARVDVRIASEAEKRPLTPVVDENGFLHGEPVSEGRTARGEAQ